MPTAIEKIKRWKKDPLYFVTTELKADPDPWQAEALRAFGDPSKRRIALKASKGPGKTALLSWCIWNFLACYGRIGNHPKGAGTSITDANINDNLWPELSKWQSRSEFLKSAFVWKKERVFARDHPETWFFSKRSWPKTGDKSRQADTLAGLHAEFLLFVLDEAGGIPDAVMATAEGGLATGEWGKILIAGNPTHLEGPLYRACTQERNLWEVITITSDPDSPQRSPRVSTQWAREQIEKYGRDNPWVLVNVFGEFPPSSLNTLLGPDEVERAMNQHYTIDQYNYSQKRLGVDVARFGDDRTVIFPRQGLVAFNPVIMRGANTNEIAGRVMMAKQRWGSEVEIIDDTGHWGHGVIDNLNVAGVNPIGVQFHGKAIDSDRYKNRRAEGWIRMADWIKGGGAIPRIPELVAELTVPTYTFANGKFQLEDKDQIKERLSRSPDLADALALTFMVPDLPAKDNTIPHFINSDKLKWDYDPRER